MIDLNKSQIVNPMVEAWGRDEDNEEWQKGLLAAIDHDDVVPYLLIFNNGNNSYRQCTLTNPYAKKTRLMTPFEAQSFARKLFLEKPNARVRLRDGRWFLPSSLSYDYYEWADFTDDGEMIGEPHKFEMED